MTAALWLLIGLQLRGWLRYVGRNLKSVRGVLFALFGVVLLAGPLVFVLTVSSESARPDPNVLRLYGPAYLVGYCILMVVGSGAERAVYFSPSEVNFLFAGPFSRRQLLAYKLLSNSLISLPSALFLAIWFRSSAPSWTSCIVGLLLGVQFLQLFATALAMIVSAVGAAVYQRARAVAGVVLAITLAAAFWGKDGLSLLHTGNLNDLLNSSAWQTISTPLRWFFEAYLAERVWPDLVVYSALAFGVDVILLAVVFLLDAQFLEAAAASSTRIYLRVQSLRRGGFAAVGGGKAASLSLPMPPFWGGVGPVLWRQLTTASRGLGRLALILGITAVFVLTRLLSIDLPRKDSTALTIAVLGMLAWMAVFMTQLVPFDFRGDLDRMAALKAWPLPAWRIAVGQVLTPVFLVTAVQWLVLLALRFSLEVDDYLIACGAFYVPLNFLVLTLDNFLFLRFPMRVMASGPGDFQFMGRNLLVTMLKMTAVFVAAISTIVFGLLVGVVTLGLTAGEPFGLFRPAGVPDAALRAAWAAALISGWLALASCGAALIPLTAWAFTVFDVGRDTPP